MKGFTPGKGKGRWFRGIRNMEKGVTHLSEANKGPLKPEEDQKPDRRGRV